jgi:hypothetical protein
MNEVRCLIASILLLVCGCKAAQEPHTLKPVATVKDIMESLVAHMADDVFSAVQTIISDKGTEEIQPKNDEEWQELRYAAMGLAETGNLLMLEGRAKDQGDWMKFSQGLIETAVVAADAAAAKDSERFFNAAGQVYESCRSCHMKYVTTTENSSEKNQ